jgi:hypothetical protein
VSYAGWLGAPAKWGKEWRETDDMNYQKVLASYEIDTSVVCTEDFFLSVCGRVMLSMRLSMQRLYVYGYLCEICER